METPKTVEEWVVQVQIARKSEAQANGPSFHIEGLLNGVTIGEANHILDDTRAKRDALAKKQKDELEDYDYLIQKIREAT